MDDAESGLNSAMTPGGAGGGSGTLAEMGEDLRIAKADLMAAQDTITGLRRRIVELKASEQGLRVLHGEHSLLEARYQEALRIIDAYSTSRFWRLTGPLRWLSDRLRYVACGARAWLAWAPGCRPQRVAERLAQALSPGAATSADRAQAPAEAPARENLPKLAVRYVLFDVNPQAWTGDVRLVRSLSKALMDAGHAVQFVRWDPDLDACVFISLEDRERLAHADGPSLRAEEARWYTSGRKEPSPVTVPFNSGGWLYAVHARLNGVEPAQLTAWAHRAGLKAGFVVHDAASDPDQSDARRAALAQLSRADALWPVSERTADELRSVMAAVGTGEASQPVIQTIPLAAASDRPRITQPKDGDKLILCVGAGEDPKWHVTLIQVFQEILDGRHGCEWRLVLAGEFDPALARDLTRARTAVSPVEFLGEVSAAELTSLYDWCAFTAVPAPGDGAPLALMDSLWAGKPCLCPNAGAVGDLASAGGCLTFDPLDRADLKSALRRMIDDAPLRRLLTRQAIDRPATPWSDYIAKLEASAPGADPLIYYWVDSTIKVPVNTGIQRVVRQLARGLLESGYRLVPVKWGGLDQPLQPVTPEELEHFARWNGPGPDQWCGWAPPASHLGGGWFIMGELPHDLSSAEQKAFRAEIKAAGFKAAAVFYDTIPYKMPGLYPSIFSAAHLNYMGELYNYDKVLTISNYSRGELMTVLSDAFGIPESRMDHIVAAPLAAEFPEMADQVAVSPLQDGVIEILCVGTVEPRKNHERLLDAFDLASSLSTVPLHLTIVGGGHSFEPDLAVRVKARVDANPRLDWEQKADDARIKQLYGRCAFTIYPSIEEGFGMPILESLWYGKPVICADFGAMFEVAAEGGGCVTVDVRDPTAMATAMVALANSPDRLRRLAEEAKARTFKTWRGYTSDVAGKLGLAQPTESGLTADR